MTAPSGPLPRALRWLLDALGLKRQRAVRKVPILGVEGSGKSSLIVTLGQYVSVERLGAVSLESMPLFLSLLPHVQRGTPQPATVRYSPFHVELKSIREPDGSLLPVDLVLSSEDIPGQDFRFLCAEVKRNPNLAVDGAGAGAEVLRRFRDLLTGCHGFVFVVDLLRDLDPAVFRSDPVTHIGRAYADQVEPIMVAILLAARGNAVLAHKPMYFVFSKPDLHGLPPERVVKDFEHLMAIPLGPLRTALVNIGQYDVQCAGWQMDTCLAGLGIERFLSDLAHATGAVTAPGSQP